MIISTLMREHDESPCKRGDAAKTRDENTDE
jgi:hypothetical protein